jgi:hypothetical protein
MNIKIPGKHLSFSVATKAPLQDLKPQPLHAGLFSGLEGLASWTVIDL